MSEGKDSKKPEIRFYHLQSQSLGQALPALLSKVIEKKHRVVVKLPDQGRVEALDSHLWTYEPNSFLPHGSKKSGNAEQQPIWLTCDDENPNDADVLILAEGAVFEQMDEFSLSCEIFDGQDQDALQVARARWKTFKDQGYDLTYWQQTANGGWDKKA